MLHSNDIHIATLYSTNPNITDNIPLNNADKNFDMQYTIFPVRVMINLIFPPDLSAHNVVTNGIDESIGRNMVIYGLTDVYNMPVGV